MYDLSQFDLWTIDNTFFYGASYVSEIPSDSGLEAKSVGGSRLDPDYSSIEVVFIPKDNDKSCSNNNNQYNAKVIETISRVKKPTLIEHVIGNEKPSVLLNKEFSYGVNDKIIIHFGEYIVEVRGTPTKGYIVDNGVCQDRITINPPTQNQEIVKSYNLVLSLHGQNENNGVDIGNVLICDDRQLRTLGPITINNNDKPSDTCVIYGALASQKCSCDGDEIINPGTEQSLSGTTFKYKNDCDGTEFKYCIEEGKCTNVRRCIETDGQTPLTDNCISVVGNQWKTCQSGNYFWGGECQTVVKPVEPSVVTCTDGAAVTVECKCGTGQCSVVGEYCVESQNGCFKECVVGLNPLSSSCYCNSGTSRGFCELNKICDLNDGCLE